MTQYFWGIQAPKCTPMAPGLLPFFGHNSRLGEHISRLGGHGPEMPLEAPSLLSYPHQNACFGE